MEENSLKDFAFVEHVMQAFTIRDLQTTMTVASWMYKNSIDFGMLEGYLRKYPIVQQLRQLGYFVLSNDPAHLRAIREFEKSLPRDLRKALRRERLSTVTSGPIKSGG